jgi:hypothetical protein
VGAMKAQYFKAPGDAAWDRQAGPIFALARPGHRRGIDVGPSSSDPLPKRILVVPYHRGLAKAEIEGSNPFARSKILRA